MKTAVVFGFMRPDDRPTEPVEELADGFSRNLTSAGAKFAGFDRAQVRAVMEKNRIAAGVIRDSEISRRLARQLDAEALIVGRLAPVDGKLKSRPPRRRTGKASRQCRFPDQLRTKCELRVPNHLSTIT